MSDCPHPIGEEPMVCTVKRQLFDSPLGAMAVRLKASNIWIVQFNQIVQSLDGE
jgi:hypothetical protein